MQDKTIRFAIVALQKGDSKAFDTIYEKTHRLVYSIAFAYMKDQGLAQDIVQDTYLQFLKNLPNFQLQYPLNNYLITIAKNLSLNLLQKRGREINEDFTNKEWQYQDLISETSFDFDTPILNLAKKHLNQEELEVLLLIAVSGYKRKEVAEILQQPLSTITWRYQQILKKMQVILQKEGYS